MQRLTLFLTPPLERVWLQTVTINSKQQNCEHAAVQSKNILFYCLTLGGHSVFYPQGNV